MKYLYIMILLAIPGYMLITFFVEYYQLSRTAHLIASVLLGAVMGWWAGYLDSKK